MQIIHHVVEARWRSKCMIGDRVSRMSITVKLLEERMKRATRLVPYAFFFAYFMFHLALVDELEKTSFVQNKASHCSCSHSAVNVFSCSSMILLLPQRDRGLLGAPLRSVLHGRAALANLGFRRTSPFVWK